MICAFDPIVNAHQSRNRFARLAHVRLRVNASAHSARICTLPNGALSAQAHTGTERNRLQILPKNNRMAGAPVSGRRRDSER
jgi:hypothetical protein